MLNLNVSKLDAVSSVINDTNNINSPRCGRRLLNYCSMSGLNSLIKFLRLKDSKHSVGFLGTSVEIFAG